MKSLQPLIPAALIVLALGGCGLGAGNTPSAVEVTVTRDFGAGLLKRSGALKLSGQETVMSVLRRNYTVTTRYGGGFVQSIDGLAGGQEHGGPVDWFYYVNGIEASKGAASTDVDRGDQIWWDHHDWSETDDVPAVVGSFPEPFVHGLGGKRWPVRIECADVGGTACHAVTEELRAAKVPAAIAAIGSAGEPETLRVVVAPWTQVQGDLGAQVLREGPRGSGVYARFTDDGRSLELLDEDGHAGRTLAAGAGLIAATRQNEQAPVWLITGTDDQGVEAAARSFDRGALHDHFALAVTGSERLPLPLEGS